MFRKGIWHFFWPFAIVMGLGTICGIDKGNLRWVSGSPTYCCCVLRTRLLDQEASSRPVRNGLIPTDTPTNTLNRTPELIDEPRHTHVYVLLRARSDSELE